MEIYISAEESKKSHKEMLWAWSESCVRRIANWFRDLLADLNGKLTSKVNLDSSSARIWTYNDALCDAIAAPALIYANFQPTKEREILWQERKNFCSTVQANVATSHLYFVLGAVQESCERLFAFALQPSSARNCLKLGQQWPFTGWRHSATPPPVSGLTRWWGITWVILFALHENGKLVNYPTLHLIIAGPLFGQWFMKVFFSSHSFTRNPVSLRFHDSFQLDNKSSNRAPLGKQ